MRLHLAWATALLITLLGFAPTAHAASLPSLHATEAAAQGHLSLDVPELGSAHAHATPKLFEGPLELDESKLLQALFGDDGGGSRSGMSGDVKPVLGFLTGFLVGFGIGHLIVGNQQGFILFLVVDVVFVVALVVFYEFLPHVVAVLATLGFIVERLFQGYDAYMSGGGRPLAQQSLDATIYAAREEPLLPSLPRLETVTRTFSCSF